MDKAEAAREKLKPAINHKDHVGRFHVDFETGDEWTTKISGAKSTEGVLLVESGEFGLSGKVVQQLPLDSSSPELHTALTKANRNFVASTEKKEYQAHVRKGHRLGINYESVIPYGEDRDGDGEIDQKGRRRKRR
jgi:hypothetical protein